MSAILKTVVRESQKQRRKTTRRSGATENGLRATLGTAARLLRVVLVLGILWGTLVTIGPPIDRAIGTMLRPWQAPPSLRSPPIAGR